MSRSTACRSACKPGLVYYLLNKPAGVVTTSQRHRTAARRSSSWCPREPRVFPVGRLDIDTEGLLLLTNDGDLAQRLTHPSHGVEKEYLAEVAGGSVAQGKLRRLREGIELDDGVTAPGQGVAAESRGVADHDPRGPQPPGAADVRGHRPPGAAARAGAHRPAARRRARPRRVARALTTGEVKTLIESVGAVGRSYADRP